MSRKVGSECFHMSLPNPFRTPLAQARSLPALVIDTNVVLDWLLFADSRVMHLAAAIDTGRARWIATLQMRAELADVLSRDIGGRSLRDTNTVLAAFDARVHLVAPAPACGHPSMRCTDSDDQPFIDLAWHGRAEALISRDRAVLRLARHAREHGFAIVAPEHWPHVGS